MCVTICDDEGNPVWGKVCYKLGGLKHQKFILPRFWRPEVKNQEFAWPCCLCSLCGRIPFGLFLASGGGSPSLAFLGLQLRHISPSLCHHMALFLCASVWPCLFPPIGRPHLRPTPIQHDLTLTKIPFPNYVTFWGSGWAWVLRTWFYLLELPSFLFSSSPALLLPWDRTSSQAPARKLVLRLSFLGKLG